MPDRRYLRPNEPMALDSRSLHYDADRGAFFWMFSDPPKRNERVGSVAVVYVRGELDHHDSYYGESYEGILCRLGDAMTGKDAADQHERAHRWDEDYQPVKCEPPSAIVMCIDSPGGVVSGLNETVKSIINMRRKSAIPLVAYVDEMAASAAYALACACDRIYCPPSSIIGSIGVISTMISQAAKNKKDGYDVRLITSGQRKADGHVHAPITAAAVGAERERLDQLADAFFQLASDRRGISKRTVRGFEANIFLGQDAVKRKLSDGIRSWSDLVASLQPKTTGPKTPVVSGGNKTDRREMSSESKTTLTGSEKPHTTKVQVNTMDFDELIKKYEARLAKAVAAGKTDRILSVSASLEAAKKAKKDAEDEEEDEEEDDDEESKAAKAGAAAAERMMAARAGKKAEKDKDPYEEKKESEEEEAKAVLAAVAQITGATGQAAIGALNAMANMVASTAKDVAKMKLANAASEKASLIASASGSYVMPHEVAWLESQPLATVKGFIEHRKTTGMIVNTEDGHLLKPKAPEGTEASLPSDVLEMVESAVASWSGDKAAYRAALVKSHLDAAKTAAKNANGAGGRY